MPLLDHFRQPLEARAPWSSISSFWVVALAKRLNSMLPRDRYQAMATVHLGNQLEADISEFEIESGVPFEQRNGSGGLAVLPSPMAVATVEPSFPDEFEIQIKDVRDGMRLVAAIEFISPSNKDRERERTHFISKCLAYLDAGVGLVILDIVTSRSANLHNELMVMVNSPKRAMLPDRPTYVAGYRCTRNSELCQVETWPYLAAVGRPIPSVPLALKDGPIVQLDLEGTYTEACIDHNV